jgi:hypothetical protein
MKPLAGFNGRDIKRLAGDKQTKCGIRKWKVILPGEEKWNTARYSILLEVKKKEKDWK